MPDANGSETLPERLTRVRAEVARLRAALDAQIDSGAEKSTGVFRIAEVDFKKLEARLRIKERELAALESATLGDAAGVSAALGFAQLVNRGQPA